MIEIIDVTPTYADIDTYSYELTNYIQLYRSTHSEYQIRKGTIIQENNAYNDDTAIRYSSHSASIEK